MRRVPHWTIILFAKNQNVSNISSKTRLDDKKPLWCSGENIVANKSAPFLYFKCFVEISKTDIAFE